MYRCLEISNLGVELPWEECLPLARQAGFEGIDVRLTADSDVPRLRQLLAQHGLRPGGMALPYDFRHDAPKVQAGERELEKIARKASELGQRRFYIWIWPFSDSLPWKQNFEFHVQRLGRAARILLDHDCSLGLEFIGPRSCRVGQRFSFCHNLEQMLELAAAVGPNAGVLLDSWHWYTSLGTVEELRQLDAQQVVYVHINDAPAGIPVEHQQDLVRRQPGATGVIDLPGFLDALRAIGYDGPIVPEPFDSALRQLSPAQAIETTAQALQQVWLATPVTPRPQSMRVVATGRERAWLVEQPVPSAQGNEVIVKLMASPLCGSNLGAFRGKDDCINDGHEGAGIVVDAAQSHLLKVGDRVALAPLSSCGSCPQCRAGDVIFCQTRPGVHGNFAQFTRVSDIMCTLVPDDIDYEHAALMGCALGPAYEALKQLAVRAFDTVVITGLGPVGLGATALATFLGARVIVLDPEGYRRELATQLGADEALDPTASDAISRLKALTGGVKKAIDCSGNAAAQRLLIDVAGVRGRIALIGENHRELQVVPSRDFIRKGLTVTGCWHMNQNDAPELFAFLRRAKDKANLLISHRFSFDQVQEAFATFASGRSAKVVLLPWAEKS